MGKVKYFGITFVDDKQVYSAGQRVTGDVVIEVVNNIEIKDIEIEICGYAFVYWTETIGTGDDKREESYSARQDYIHEQYKVPTTELKAGSFRHSFDFQIPSLCPSSFTGGVGTIEYYVKATVHTPWPSSDIKNKQYFTVHNPLNANQVPTSSQYPASAEDSETLCCLCCASGPIIGKHMLPKTFYVPGEVLPIRAECINNSDRQVEVHMELLQSVTCKSTTSIKVTWNVVAKTPKRKLNRNNTEAWNNESIIVPVLPETGPVGCEIVDIAYYWQLIMNPAGLGSKLRVPIMIIIGSAPDTLILK